MNLIFALFSGLIGFFILFTSRSKKGYQELVEKKGKKFADKNERIVKIGGYILVVYSFLRVIFILI